VPSCPPEENLAADKGVFPHGWLAYGVELSCDVRLGYRGQLRRAEGEMLFEYAGILVVGRSAVFLLAFGNVLADGRLPRDRRRLMPSEGSLGQYELRLRTGLGEAYSGVATYSLPAAGPEEDDERLGTSLADAEAKMLERAVP